MQVTSKQLQAESLELILYAESNGVGTDSDRSHIFWNNHAEPTLCFLIYSILSDYNHSYGHHLNSLPVHVMFLAFIGNMLTLGVLRYSFTF